MMRTRRMERSNDGKRKLAVVVVVVVVVVALIA